MRFPVKITSSCIWVAIPVDWLILHWYACGADGRTVGRSVGVRSRDYQFVYHIFIPMVLRCGRFAREISAINFGLWQTGFHTIDARALLRRLRPFIKETQESRELFKTLKKQHCQPLKEKKVTYYVFVKFCSNECFVSSGYVYVVLLASPFRSLSI